MTLQASINGDSRRIKLQNGQLHWGDLHLECDIHPTEPGIYSVHFAGRSVTVVLGENGWAQAAGRVFQVEITDPRNASAQKGAGGRAGQVKLTSPMPGKVIRVLVSPGHSVTAGQGLIVVEAMKMQNEMKAPRDARVVSVQAQESATVAAGEVLLVLE